MGLKIPLLFSVRSTITYTIFAWVLWLIVSLTYPVDDIGSRDRISRIVQGNLLIIAKSSHKLILEVFTLGAALSRLLFPFLHDLFHLICTINDMFDSQTKIFGLGVFIGASLLLVLLRKVYSYRGVISGIFIQVCFLLMTPLLFQVLQICPSNIRNLLVIALLQVIPLAQSLYIFRFREPGFHVKALPFFVIWPFTKTFYEFIYVRTKGHNLVGSFFIICQFWLQYCGGASHTLKILSKGRNLASSYLRYKPSNLISGLIKPEQLAGLRWDTVRTAFYSNILRGGTSVFTQTSVPINLYSIALFVIIGFLCIWQVTTLFYQILFYACLYFAAYETSLCLREKQKRQVDKKLGFWICVLVLDLIVAYVPILGTITDYIRPLILVLSIFAGDYLVHYGIKGVSWIRSWF